MPLIKNDPATDAAAHRCGHNYPIETCPYEYCQARALATALRNCTSQLEEHLAALKALPLVVQVEQLLARSRAAWRTAEMADNTPIESADATWNIVTGCSVVSPD